MSKYEEYFKKISADQIAEFERIYKIVTKIAPDVEGVISYGMPVLKYKNKYLIGFCVFKNHLSIFPGAGAIAVTKDKLGDYKTSKGTVQFTLDKLIPETIIKDMITFRVSQILQN